MICLPRLDGPRKRGGGGVGSKDAEVENKVAQIVLKLSLDIFLAKKRR